MDENADERRQEAYRADIEKIRKDGELILGLVRTIMTELAVHNTKQLHLEAQVERLDRVIFGDGTGDNPGYIARANIATEKSNARIDTVVSTQESYSRVIWTVVTPILSLLGVGVIILLVIALAAK
jgi:hypothetical protein